MATQGLVATFLSASPPVAGAAPADERCIHELFDRHARGLFRLACALLRDPDAAQDVVQEAFLKLARHVSEGRSLPNPQGWLYTVAAHACRDRQRVARRWLPWSTERDRRVAVERPDAGDASEAVLQALARLRGRDRLLIALKTQGLTYEEIAAAAGIRAASVGRLLARALDRLSRELDRSGENNT